MDAASNREDFQRKYLAALMRVPPAKWQELWTLFLTDTWFLSELAAQAHWALRTSGEPMEWLHDVEHESMLLLGGKLRTKPDLGLNSPQFADEYCVVLRKVIHHLCLQSLKHIRRIYRTGEPLSEESDVPVSLAIFQAHEQALALSEAIEVFPQPLCSVLRLYHLNGEVKEICTWLNLSYKKTRPDVRRAIQKMRRDFGSS
jgi:hypothetical protein